MPPQETSTASGSPPGNPAGAGAPPGGAASRPVQGSARKGTAARGMSVAPLALAVLAQVGAIGHGAGTGATAPASTQPAKCKTGISDYQTCHDSYPTGCSGAGGYDGYLNSLKNELVDPAGEPQQAFDVPSLKALETGLPADLTKTNHEALEGQMTSLGEGEVASLTGFLYYAKDGGAESSNCLLKGPDNIDFHIGIGSDAGVAARAKAKKPGLSPEDRSQAVIVEMTPHWRAKYEPGWNLALVQKAVGRQVYVVGQLLADNEHDDAKDDCAYAGAGGHGPNCWRGTVWELHPVTRFLVCAAAQCDEKGTGPGWTPLESFDPAKADAAAATKAPSPASPGATAPSR
jgi:hypothetical protein